MEWVFILSCVLGLLVFLAILQQVWLAYQGRGIRGPGLVPPFVGNIVAMIMTPWNFYIQQEKLGKLSWNSFLGLYVRCSFMPCCACAGPTNDRLSLRRSHMLLHMDSQLATRSMHARADLHS